MRGRRAGKRSYSSVDPVHYLGYVEDGESVASIMKKFEELERLQSNDDKTCDILNDHQLKELFIRTSAYTVESASMIDAGMAVDYDDEIFVDSIIAVESDEQMIDNGGFGDTTISEEEYVIIRGKTNKGKYKSQSKKVKTPDHKPTVRKRKSPKEPSKSIRSNSLTITADHHPNKTIVVKLPHPLTLSWALIIEPPSSPTNLATTNNMISMDAFWRDNDIIGNDWLGVLMDPPFCESYGPLGEFSKLSLPRRMNQGFLFIWSDTEYISDLITVCSKWKFNYVENLAWIHKDINNSIRETKGPIFKRSHSTLIIFRKEGDSQTIRHQRNPDCIFDFVKPSYSFGRRTSVVFKFIEELLPDAVQSKKLLHLWASKGVERFSNWTCVYQ